MTSPAARITELLEASPDQPWTLAELEELQNVFHGSRYAPEVASLVAVNMRLLDQAIHRARLLRVRAAEIEASGPPLEPTRAGTTAAERLEAAADEVTRRILCHDDRPDTLSMRAYLGLAARCATAVAQERGIKPADAFVHTLASRL